MIKGVTIKGQTHNMNLQFDTLQLLQTSVVTVPKFQQSVPIKFHLFTLQKQKYLWHVASKYFFNQVNTALKRSNDKSVIKLRIKNCYYIKQVTSLLVIYFNTSKKICSIHCYGYHQDNHCNFRFSPAFKKFAFWQKLQL